MSQIILSNYIEELTSLKNDGCIQCVIDNDNKDCKSTIMIILDTRFLRYLCVHSKQELLDIYRNYLSITNSSTTTMFNIDLTCKNKTNVSTSDPIVPVEATPTNPTANPDVSAISAKALDTPEDDGDLDDNSISPVDLIPKPNLKQPPAPPNAKGGFHPIVIPISATRTKDC